MRYVFVLLCLFLPLMVSAQLRLDDVFADEAGEPGPQATLSDLDRDPALAEELRASITEDIARQQFRRGLRKADLLASWYDKKSEAYEETLWLRARALEGLGEKETLKNVALDYLTSFGERGKHRTWFLVRLALALEQEGATLDAVKIWDMLQKETGPIRPEEALLGGEALVRAAKAPAARTLLARGFPNGASEGLKTRHDFLLVESMLLEDEASITPPEPLPMEAPLGPALNLRLALLWELRGDPGQAEELYSQLLYAPEMLARNEQELLDRRARVAGLIKDSE